MVIKGKSNLIDVHLGGRIRTGRLSRGLTLKMLAEKLDVSFQQLQKYETGQDRIDVRRLLQIASTLQVHVTYFFDDFPFRKKQSLHDVADYVARFNNSREGVELARAFTRLKNRQVRHCILDLVLQLSKESRRGAYN